MGQDLTLIGCGDSWTWGTELVDPSTCPNPLKYTFDLQHLPINVEYRESHRYLKLFADNIGARSIVDLSQGGCSNDTIVRTLIHWLASNGYLSGKDTSDLFVSIGWTNPERKDFYHNKQITTIDGKPSGWFTLYPNFNHDFGYPELSKFHEIYVAHLWNEEEYINRWVTQIIQIESILKKHNIKYVMHQAFYHHHIGLVSRQPNKNTDYTAKINESDKIIWNTIDSVKFMHKDDPITGTFFGYISNHVGQENIASIFPHRNVHHPNALGHKIWAEHMYQYCKDNNLL
jgi:hypothetical protein